MVRWTRQVVCAQVFDFAGDEEVMQNNTGHRRGSLAGFGTVVEPGVGVGVFS